MKHYLNKREETVMKIIWEQDQMLLKDIIAAYPKPKPPNTTIASIVKKLEQRGFVTHQAYGRTHVYSPVLKQDEYKSSEIQSLVQSYFSGSFEELVSFFSKEKGIDKAELDEILEKLKK